MEVPTQSRDLSTYRGELPQQAAPLDGFRVPAVVTLANLLRNYPALVPSGGGIPTPAIPVPAPMGLKIEKGQWYADNPDEDLRMAVGVPSVSGESPQDNNEPQRSVFSDDFQCASL